MGRSRTLPQDGSSQTLTDVLGLPWPDWLNVLLIGTFFAVTLAPVLRVCAAAQTSFANMLLGNSHVGWLQQRVAVLTKSRSAAANAEVDSLRRLVAHDVPGGVEVGRVGRRYVHRRPSHMLQVAACVSERRSEVRHHLLGLGGDVTRRDHRAGFVQGTGPSVSTRPAGHGGRVRVVHAGEQGRWNR